MGRFAGPRGDAVGVDVDRASPQRRVKAQVGQPALFGRFAKRRVGHVDLAGVGMAAQLQPAVELAVMVQEQPAIGREHKGRAGQVRDWVGLAKTIGVRPHKGADRRDIAGFGFIGGCVGGEAQKHARAGVVGEQPVLKPGERFAYTSGAPLPTPSGFMSGSYEMQAADGSRFEAEIPAFSLDSPFAPKSIN